MIAVYFAHRDGEQFRKEDKEVDSQSSDSHVYSSVGLMMMMMMMEEEEEKEEEEEEIELSGLRYVGLEVRLFHSETLDKRE